MNNKFDEKAVRLELVKIAAQRPPISQGVNEVIFDAGLLFDFVMDGTAPSKDTENTSDRA